MSDVFFFGLILLVSLLFIANGLLMLFSPSTHARFLNWWMQVDRWSKPDEVEPSGQARGMQIEKRIAGLVLSAMGCYAVRVPVKFLLRQEWAVTIWRPAPVGDQQGGATFPTVTAVAMIVAGLWLTLRPNDLAEWSKAHMPTPREVPASILKKWKFGFRLMGILLFISGIFTIIATWR